MREFIAFLWAAGFVCYMLQLIWLVMELLMDEYCTLTKKDVKAWLVPVVPVVVFLRDKYKGLK